MRLVEFEKNLKKKKNTNKQLLLLQIKIQLYTRRQKDERLSEQWEGKTNTEQIL